MVMTSDRIVVGTRGSQLALAQAETVLNLLRKVSGDHKFEVREITTKGDEERNKRLQEIAGEGLFVKEIQLALLAGEIDLAVHSVKDVPLEAIDGLQIAAYPRREDPRDVLVADLKGLDSLRQGDVLATGSLRRKAQLLHRFPGIKVEPVRGNIATRLQKVKERGWSGAVLAAAGLHRLGWEEHIAAYLPYEICLPAAAQGALAVEVRREDERALKLAGAIDREAVSVCVTAERKVLELVGGGCNVPVGVLAALDGNELSLWARVGSENGKRMLDHRVKGDADRPEVVAERIVDGLTERGAIDILQQEGLLEGGQKER